MEKGSVATVFVHSALAEVRAQGRDVDALLLRVGIAPSQLTLAGARVTAAQYGALWLAVAQELDDEFFGQDSRRMKVGSFALMARHALAAATLGEALRAMLACFRILLDDFQLSLEREGELARVSVHEHPGPRSPRRFAHETLLVMVHGLACWLVGRRIGVVATEFSLPEPPYSREYQVMYSTTLRYGCRRTALVFPASALSLPVVQSRATLQRFLRGAPTNIIVKYKNTDGLVAQVRQRLKRLPVERWPDFPTLAQELGMAPTTLRRRLEQEGQSYRTMTGQLRRDLAIEKLTHGRQSIAEIALDLGFTDASAFHRAFRVWTGRRPGEYRG